MFTENELKAVAALRQQFEKQASWVNPLANNGYTLNMPALKEWGPPKQTFGDALGGMASGLGGLVGTTAQSLLTGRENPGVAENLLNHGFKMVTHGFKPEYVRRAISLDNFTKPFSRARGQYGQAFRQLGEPGAMIGPELGERYRILKEVFAGKGLNF